MKTQHRSLLADTLGLTIAAAGLLALAALTGTSSAATNPPPKKSATAAATNASAQVAIVIPTSEFIIPASPAEGRDPFFPNSIRTTRTVVTTNKVAKAAPVKLVLQGISGTEAKRFALINGRTFVVGEEAGITVGNTRINIHCLSITEDAAVVEADGKRQELKLRPGLSL